MSANFNISWSAGMIAACSMSALCATGALADPVDFTTLTPAYITDMNYFPGEMAPGFSYSATPTQLSITGPANLPDNGLAAYANLPMPVTGDFSATVRTSVTNNAGIGYYAGFSTTFAGLGYGSYGGVGYAYSNYGRLSGGNVVNQSVSFPAQTVTEELSRSGDALTASIEHDGQWSQVLKISSLDVLSPAYISLTAYGSPAESLPFTATYTSFDVTTIAPTTASDITGGTATEPVPLPAATIGSVTGALGAPDGPKSSYFTFYWQGGDFEANVGVFQPDLLQPSQSVAFELCRGIECLDSDVIGAAQADSSNDWQSILSDDLTAGYYTAAVILKGPSDPGYFVDFATPVVGTGALPEPVPEPSTWAMLAIGFAGLGFAGYRGSRNKPPRPTGRPVPNLSL